MPIMQDRNDAAWRAALANEPEQSKEVKAITDRLFSVCLAFTQSGELSLLDTVTVLANQLRFHGYTPRFFERKRALILDSIGFQNNLTRTTARVYRDDLADPPLPCETHEGLTPVDVETLSEASEEIPLTENSSCLCGHTKLQHAIRGNCLCYELNEGVWCSCREFTTAPQLTPVLGDVDDDGSLEF